MNGIFGFLHFDNAPLEPERLAVMGRALEYWAADGLTTWNDGPIGLGCAALRSTPEAAHESLPLHDPGSGLTLTAGARLDNRQELISDLRLLMDNWQFHSAIGNRQSAIPDDVLILLAYQKWGVDCVHHLLGDWHFALWDASNQRLFLARDQHGLTGLVYYQGNRWFAFGSGQKALLSLPDLPQQPNLLRVAQVLTSWPGEGVQTAYKGILRLPPAHRMVVYADTGQVNIERYWRLEDVSMMRSASDEAYVEGFLEVFSRAVQVRLRSNRPLGTTLSGGLDSGSVTAMAARLLAAEGQRLVAFTSIPLTNTTGLTGKRFGDESGFAAESVRFLGNVDHILVDSYHLSPLAGIERALFLQDEPAHAAANQYWLMAILEAAQQRGLGALLIGQGGNATISWTGGQSNLLPWLIDRDWRGFWQAFERERRAHGISRKLALRRFVFKPLILPLWLRMKAAVPKGRPTWQSYSALRLEFGRALDLDRQMAIAGYEPNWSANFDSLGSRLELIRPGKNPIGAIKMENGAGYGLEERDPTLDRQVMEYCLATPEDQFRRNGINRWLIRRAMEGYLPDLVRLNQRRGLQAADLAKRILAGQDEIQATLHRLSLHELCRQVIDLPRLNRVLQSFGNQIDRQNTNQGSAILLRGLMAGLFLTRF